MSALWDDAPTPAGTPIHACAGSVCQVCATSRTSREAKATGTERVKRDPEWYHRASGWISGKAKGYQFTADDLVAAIGKPEGSSNQIGAILRSWSFGEVIAPVGVTEAGRKESHGRLLRVWEVMA